VSKRCHLSPPLGVVLCTPSTGPEELLQRGVSVVSISSGCERKGPRRSGGPEARRQRRATPS
jgi:hypothetical protein